MAEVNTTQENTESKRENATKIKQTCASPTFNTFDIFCVLFSLGTFVADLSTDIILVVEYSRYGHIGWAVSTLLLMLLPASVIQLFSLRWHKLDEQISTSHYIFHACLLGVAQRYYFVLRTGLEARTSGDIIDFQKLYQQQSDLCMLHLFESFMESAPQLVLQLYVMLNVGDWHSWTGLSASASLCSLAWAIAAYTRAMRRVRPDKDRVKWPGLVLQATWRGGMLAARISAMVLFALAFHYWLLVVMGIHWVAMTTWVVLQDTDFCPTVWEERIYNGIVGIIYCFSFFNICEGKSRRRVFAFYSVIVTQNVACLIFVVSLNVISSIEIIVVSAVFILGGTVIGLCSMTLYYTKFHPAGPIPCCPLFGEEGSVPPSPKTPPDSANKVNTLRTLKHIWTLDRTSSLGQTEPKNCPHSDDGCTDKKLLLENWIARSGSPMFASAPISQLPDNNLVDNSLDDIEFHTVTNTPDVSLYDKGVVNDGYKCSEKICELTPEVDKLNERRQKRRGICSPTELGLKLLQLNETELAKKGTFKKASSSCEGMPPKKVTTTTRGICSPTELGLKLLQLSEEDPLKTELGFKLLQLSETEQSSKAICSSTELGLKLLKLYKKDQMKEASCEGICSPAELKLKKDPSSKLGLKHLHLVDGNSSSSSKKVIYSPTPSKKAVYSPTKLGLKLLEFSEEDPSQKSIYELGLKVLRLTELESSSKKAIYSPTELGLKLLGLTETEPSSKVCSGEESSKDRKAAGLWLGSQKRRGICSSDQLVVDLSDGVDALTNPDLDCNLNDDVKLKRRPIYSVGSHCSSDLNLKNLYAADLSLRNLCGGVRVKAGSDDKSVCSSGTLRPEEYLEMSSEVLSAHDYENICAVNIARERWGLRSWEGYTDIETFLHDDSTVRDRRRDTLTSTVTGTSASSEISSSDTTSSPPLLPMRLRPLRSRQDDYLDTLAYDLVDCDKRRLHVVDYPDEEIESNVFVAKPYVVDQHGMFFPLGSTLEPIEELEEPLTPDKPSRKPRSALVATIDEIRRGTDTDSPRNVYHRTENVWDDDLLHSTSKSVVKALWSTTGDRSIKNVPPVKSNSSEHLLKPDDAAKVNLLEGGKIGGEMKRLKGSSGSRSVVKTLWTTYVHDSSPFAENLKTPDQSPCNRLPGEDTQKSEPGEKMLKAKNSASKNVVKALWSNCVNDNCLDLESSKNGPSDPSPNISKATRPPEILTKSVCSDISKKNQSLEFSSSLLRLEAQPDEDSHKRQTRVGSKPRRKFSLLREKFEPKLRQEDQILGDSSLEMGSTINLIDDLKSAKFTPPVITKAIRNQNQKSCLNEEQFEGEISEVTHQDKNLSFPSSLRDKRNVFLKQVLSPPKFNHRNKRQLNSAKESPHK